MERERVRGKVPEEIDATKTEIALRKQRLTAQTKRFLHPVFCLVPLAHLDGTPWPIFLNALFKRTIALI